MGNNSGCRGWKGPRQVLFPFLLFLSCGAFSDQICYSIPEELPKGSVVGNLSTDLSLRVQDLPSRKLRINDGKKYFTLSEESGDLLVNDRMDREQICPPNRVCTISLEMVVENPFNVFHINIKIQDVNDNAPRFSRNVIKLNISESTLPGARFAIEPAQDPDVGSNSLQNYHLSNNSEFVFEVKETNSGKKYVELVLEKPLDRERQRSHSLVLTALDGGDPPLSSTAQILILVVDANDNPPVFSQDVYRVSLQENVPPGTSVLRVRATDQDEGVNAEVSYAFAAQSAHIQFSLDHDSGEMQTLSTLDFEEIKKYSMVLEARDKGGLVAQCTVEVEILDDNDNVPEVILTSVSTMIPEDSVSRTVIALFKTQDLDSGENGEVTCRIQQNVPFTIESSSKNYYKLVTDGALDREQTPEYNVTITATDMGKPPLSSSTSVILQIGDVNDNAPIFHQASYVVHVAENNPLGASIAQVCASDPDLGPNGRVSYSIVASDLGPQALSSYVSVSAHSGVVFAQRAFDHEQLRAFELTLQARDQGSPALSANVSLRVLVGDRNDNAPRVLYPALGPDGSALFDMVPLAAQPGYLVTKVVAVDADSGHNAWLSYHVLQASEPGLFSLGLRTGEVRTARALGERNAAHQRLLVAVCDGGQPPLSATATLHLVFADSLQEALSDLRDTAKLHSESKTNFYLVVALALVSVLFFLTALFVLILRCQRLQNGPVLDSFPRDLYPTQAPKLLGNCNSMVPYSHQVCAAPTNPGLSEFTFLKPSSLGLNNSLTAEIPCGKEGEPDDSDCLDQNPPSKQAPPNTDWRFSQAQRPGTSGSQNGDETGTWPNNQFDTEMLQAMILASASEAADGTSTLGGGAGTMGLSARYGPQFTLQHVPDYRQNVYIPGSNATLTNAAGKRDGKAPAGGNGNKKKSGKKEKK
ncbi:protocadherin gamma-B5 isoform X21 [Choloepus didactylus]|uniref:protocadherin gamma-B5 isoform X21 n=1 Tax=Choloepus didactylus TaxID=27675 RepID=UPI00189DE81D|nr:protocadherin gamma-B5 isoform X21 [Choloepus didactylus]